jgi:hypothetical protein
MPTEPDQISVPESSATHHDPDGDALARHDWVAKYAYFLAEARGFTPVQDLNDWLEAERAYLEQGMAKGETD